MEVEGGGQRRAAGNLLMHMIHTFNWPIQLSCYDTSTTYEIVSADPLWVHTHYMLIPPQNYVLKISI